MTLDRIGLDRLSLYMILRISTATDDAHAIYRGVERIGAHFVLTIAASNLVPAAPVARGVTNSGRTRQDAAA